MSAPLSVPKYMVVHLRWGVYGTRNNAHPVRPIVGWRVEPIAYHWSLDAAIISARRLSGRAFIMGAASIPKYIYKRTYNGKRLPEC